MPSTITTSSLTATSVTVSWTQPPFSFTPVGYSITVTRVTESDRVLCTTIDRKSITAISNSATFADLHEFSLYIVVVTARFREFGLISHITPSASKEFITLSAGMYTYNDVYIGS